MSAKNGAVSVSVSEVGGRKIRAASKPQSSAHYAHSADLIGASLTWKRAGNGWRLFDGRRRFGGVVPDDKHPGMWRCVLSGGRLSDMANLSWARNAVMEAAVRELVFEARQGPATDPSNCPEKRGVFSLASRRSDFNDADHAEPPADNGGAA